jgi:hypothetical protein
MSACSVAAFHEDASTVCRRSKTVRSSVRPWLLLALRFFSTAAGSKSAA